MQTGSSETLIGWKSGQTTFVPLWDRMEGAWLRTQAKRQKNLVWFGEIERKLAKLSKTTFAYCSSS